MVKILRSSASTLSSNGVRRMAEEKKLVDILKENDYPLWNCQQGIERAVICNDNTSE